MTPAAVHPSMFASIGVIALVLWRLYARIRRTIGRQTFKRRRVIMTLVGFPIVLVLLLLTSFSHPINAIPLFAGAAAGALLGFYGLRLTRFEATEGGHFYTPNAHLGIALSLLFVGRLAYRFLHLQMSGELPAGPPMDFTRSPLTLLIFATLAGYYVSYAIGLLRWSQRTPLPSPLGPAKMETAALNTESGQPAQNGNEDAHRDAATVAPTGQDQTSRSTG
ncbi:MAG: hypothetical protein ABI866_10750 [Dokdonella sp.]